MTRLQALKAELARAIERGDHDARDRLYDEIDVLLGRPTKAQLRARDARLRAHAPLWPFPCQ